MLLLVTNKKMKNNKNVKEMENKITQLPSPDLGNVGSTYSQ